MYAQMDASWGVERLLNSPRDRRDDEGTCRSYEGGGLPAYILIVTMLIIDYYY